MFQWFLSCNVCRKIPRILKWNDCKQEQLKMQHRGGTRPLLWSTYWESSSLFCRNWCSAISSLNITPLRKVSCLAYIDGKCSFRHIWLKARHFVSTVFIDRFLQRANNRSQVCLRCVYANKQAKLHAALTNHSINISHQLGCVR